MNTRVETIESNVYCAYCGKKLKDAHYLVSPEPPLICLCEKAQQELKLYEQLKEMYNLPLADSIIDMKVEIYKSKLKGEYKEPSVGYGTIVGGTISAPVSTEYLSTTGAGALIFDKQSISTSITSK